MKTKRSSRRRLWVEELEPRVVLSTLPGWSPDIAHSILATTSSNWAGYAAQTNLNTPANSAVTAVSGSWTVPAVTGSPGATAYSSVWIGIDGYTSSTVEQIGTESDWTDGAPVYYAWYEMYPRNSVTVTKLTVNPGDSVSASVTFKAGKFTLAISDVTSDQSFSTVQSIAGAVRSSAEWVVEAPSSNYGVLPLADFGTATITNASATFTKAGKSTTGAIDSPGWQAASINIVAQGNAVAATTSALTDSAGKSSFSVAYNATATSSPAPTQHHHWWWSTLAGSSVRLTGPGDGAMGVSMVNAANSNVALAPSATRVLPVAISTPPNFTQAPSLPGFRAFGLGEEVPAVDDLDVPMPNMPAPMPNRDAPPAVVPPEETTLIITPAESTDRAPVSVTPETPSERRELRAGDVGKTLLALLGVAGIVAFGGEVSPEKRTPAADEHRKRLG